MIKAIIFDCYGVLAQDSWLPFKQEYFGDDSERWAEATHLNMLHDTGRISFKEFTRRVAELAGTNPAETYARIHTSPPNTEIFKYIRNKLKRTYKIGLLSNTGQNFLHTIFTDEQIALFDATVLSCDIGYAKPSPEAYEAIIRMLRVQPHQAVFIDDQPRFVSAAEECGLQAIHYESNEQVESCLSELLVRKNNGE